MKKLLLAGLAVAALFAFNMQAGKTYKCTSVGLSYKEGNQTRNVPVTKETQKAIEKALGDLYAITVKADKKDVVVSSNGKSETLDLKAKWKGYNQYVSKSGALIFMPDKNVSSNNAAMIVPPKQLVVFYKCK